MSRRLSFLGILALIGCQSASIDDRQSQPQTHMLRLNCSGPVESDQGRLSRIAVLDTGNPVYDFALATGHAVPEDRPCEVRDFVGGRSDVDLIKFADDYRPGEHTDWAVIMFGKIDTPNLVRYSLEALGDFENLEGQAVQFAQARGLPENNQNCNLTILDFSENRRRVVHDCRNIVGQSGSPVTRIVEGENRLVGLHIGQLWMYESPKTGRPDRKGYINLLDQNTVSEIQSVIQANP